MCPLCGGTQFKYRQAVSHQSLNSWLWKSDLPSWEQTCAAIVPRNYVYFGPHPSDNHAELLQHCWGPRGRTEIQKEILNWERTLVYSLKSHFKGEDRCLIVSLFSLKKSDLFLLALLRCTLYINYIYLRYKIWLIK